MVFPSFLSSGTTAPRRQCQRSGIRGVIVRSGLRWKSLAYVLDQPAHVVYVPTLITVSTGRAGCALRSVEASSVTTPKHSISPGPNPRASRFSCSPPCAWREPIVAHEDNFTVSLYNVPCKQWIKNRVKKNKGRKRSDILPQLLISDVRSGC